MYEDTQYFYYLDYKMCLRIQKIQTNPKFSKHLSNSNIITKHRFIDFAFNRILYIVYTFNFWSLNLQLQYFIRQQYIIYVYIKHCNLTAIPLQQYCALRVQNSLTRYVRRIFMHAQAVKQRATLQRIQENMMIAHCNKQYEKRSKLKNENSGNIFYSFPTIQLRQRSACAEYFLSSIELLWQVCVLNMQTLRQRRMRVHCAATQQLRQGNFIVDKFFTENLQAKRAPTTLRCYGGKGK